jgi:hypothetical protein
VSKIDRYKKKHKNDPKPVKRVLPELGDHINIDGVSGVCVEVNKQQKYAKILCLDGVKRIVV